MKMLRMLACILVSTLLTVLSVQACENGFVQNSRCFYTLASIGSVSWSEANQLCFDNGAGRLVVIDDTNTNQLVKEQLLSNGSFKDYWLGLVESDDGSKMWQWINKVGEVP